MKMTAIAVVDAQIHQSKRDVAAARTGDAE